MAFIQAAHLVNQRNLGRKYRLFLRMRFKTNLTMPVLADVLLSLLPAE